MPELSDKLSSLGELQDVSVVCAVAADPDDSFMINRDSMV